MKFHFLKEQPVSASEITERDEKPDRSLWRMNAHCEEYQLATFCGREVLFTPHRIDRSTIPLGMRMYEIKPDEKGRPAMLAHSFIGAKFGTIITHCYIPLEDGWRVIKRRHFRISDNLMSLREFMKEHPPKQRKRQLFSM